MKNDINTKIIKFQNDQTSISGISIDGMQVVAEFRKTGNKYKYDIISYKNFCAKELEQLSRVGDSKIENDIVAEIQKTKDENKDSGINKVPRVSFQSEYGTDVFSPDQFEKYTDILRDFLASWEQLLKTPETTLPPPAEIVMCSGFENMMMTQQMQDLQFMRYGVDYVKIKVPCDICPYMYFYTDHEMSGDVEIWRKAFDPFIWSGIKI